MLHAQISKAIQISVVTDEARFAALRAEWNRLTDNCDTNTVFLRHEWFDAAWQWLKDDHDLFTLLVMRDGELIGLWPMVRHHRTYRGIRVRTLEFISVPDTQACDGICHSSNHQTVIAALRTFLAMNWRAWDVCELNKIPGDSRTANLLEAGREPRMASFKLGQAGLNPAVGLTGKWTDYYSRRSRRLKKGNNLVANRLKKEFSNVDIRWYRSENLDETTRQEILQEIINISACSWKSDTGRSLDHASPGAFIERLTAHAYRQNWLSVWILELDGRPAAMEYQLLYRGDVHALRGDFDQGIADFSPGTYLNWKLLEQLFEKDLKSYQMGQGNNAYKLRWAEQPNELYRATAYSASPRGRFMGIVENFLRPIAKKILKRKDT